MTEEEIAAYLEDLQDLAEIIVPPTSKGSILPDSADDPVILIAWAGQADILCSNDKHFFSPAAKNFATRYGIRVFTELQFLDFARQFAASSPRDNAPGRPSTLHGEDERLLAW